MSLLTEVQELNLAYLMLAQRMIREDEAAALYRLGLKADVAAQLRNLSTAELLRMAKTNMLLCQFRYNESFLVDLLSSPQREEGPAKLHAAILSSTKELAAA